jgi:uncharacterized repeat protein (TIGR04138 family)
MSQQKGEYLRRGFVSVWVGTFPSVEEAEKYFGIPDEIGVYLPPEGFINDLGVRDFPPEKLEVNFEHLLPRPVRQLLADATFSVSFIDAAVEEAARLGVREAQGVALLYDFDLGRADPGGTRTFRTAQGVTPLPDPDYRGELAPQGPSSRLQFLGAFPYVPVAPTADIQPFRTVAGRIGYPLAAVLFVIVGVETICSKRRRERGDVGHVSGQEFCEHLLNMRGEGTPDVLRAFGLSRSEDVGRVMFGLVEAGLVTRQESDSEADFQGLFDLERPEGEGPREPECGPDGRVTKGD